MLMKDGKEKMTTFKVRQTIHKLVKVNCAENEIPIIQFYEEAALAKLNDTNAPVLLRKKKKAK